jgi:putative transposase
MRPAIVAAEETHAVGQKHRARCRSTAGERVAVQHAFDLGLTDVAWKLCTNMRAEDVAATLDLALQTSGLDQAKPADRPRLLSDNGSSYLAGDLAKWLNARNIRHVRGAPYHPMTQGKIERWHQTLKNRILLENYFLPGDLEAQIKTFVDDYNHRRYHESIDNLTPADVYFGRGLTILAERERIKQQTIANRRLQHRLRAA